MPLYELTHDALTPLPQTTMVQQDFKERADLQRLLKTSIEIIDKDLLVIAEEFSQWEGSNRRIDLLAIDKEANLVVIELKRTDDGAFMDLQAIRYAAMVRALTFEQAVDEYAKLSGNAANVEGARALILDFLGWEAPRESFASEVRIVLASADFSKELTTAVLWLNDSGLDIRCVRLRPHALQSRTILEVQQVIPVPGAEEITVRLNIQKEANRVAKSKSTNDFSHYDLTVGSKVIPNLWKRGLALQVVLSAIDQGIDFEWLKSQLIYRFLAANGELSSEEFLKVTAGTKSASGTPFDQDRFFTGNDQLFKVGGNTYALTKMWDISCLPLLDQIIAKLPAGSMSYAKTAVSN